MSKYLHFARFLALSLVLLSVCVGAGFASSAPASAYYPNNHYYMAMHSKSCLDVSNGSPLDWAIVQQYHCNWTGAQQWSEKLWLVGAGFYKTPVYEIRNVQSGKCLDVRYGWTTNGAQVQQYQCNQSGAQLWYKQDANNSDWRYGRAYNYINLNSINVGSRKCLDVWNGSPNDGAKVQLWDCNGTQPQQWMSG